MAPLRNRPSICLHDAINVLFGVVYIFLLQRRAALSFEQRALCLWSEFFLLLSCSGLIALVEVSGKSQYGVVQSLLGGVDFYAHGHGLTLEGQ